MKKFLILSGIAAACLVLGIAALVVGLLVWPTPYRYDEASVDGKKISVRVARSSGKAERLTPNGWIPMKPSGPSPLAYKTCEEARAAYVKNGPWSVTFNGTVPGCNLSEAEAAYECKEFRGRARRTPSMLRFQDAPLGCDVSDLITEYGRTRTTR